MTIDLIKPGKATLVLSLGFSLVFSLTTIISSLDGEILVRAKYGGYTSYTGIGLVGLVLLSLSISFLISAPIVRRYFELPNGTIYFSTKRIVKFIAIVSFLMTLYGSFPN